MKQGYMLNHTPQVRRIVRGLAYTSIGLGIFTFAVVYGYFALNRTQAPSCEAWLEEVIRPLAYTSTIERVEQPASCKAKLWLGEEGPDFVVVCLCEDSALNIQAIHEGDTIIKEKDSLILTLSGQHSISMPYPCCE